VARRVLARSVEQRRPGPAGRVAAKTIGADDTFDHVGRDIGEGPVTEHNRDDRTTRVVPDGANGALEARRGTERRDGQALGSGHRAESPGRLRERQRRRVAPGSRVSAHPLQARAHV
jgi:hypothetical protein